MTKFAALALLVAIAPAAADAAGPSVAASDGWFRYLLPSTPAAGYVTLTNSGDTPASVVAAASPACGMLMLHRSVSKNGQEEMVMVKSVTVPAHGTFKFSPTGYHLMCMQPKMTIGQKEAVTFTLANGATIETSFPVYGPRKNP
jgi:periplasmic copper chaperone A